MEPITDEDGNKIYLNEDGCLHRLDGPAIISFNGTESWFIDGQLHREDGPAIICPDGFKAYYAEGLRHREGGPAVIYADGKERWFWWGYVALDETLYNSQAWRDEVKAMIAGVGKAPEDKD